MDSFCPYCREPTPDARAEEAHAATCAARMWWLAHYGEGDGPGAQAPVEAGFADPPGPAGLVDREAAPCRHCGERLPAEALEAHQLDCEQRRWMVRNYHLDHGARPAPARPPPLPRPRRPPSSGLLTDLLRRKSEESTQARLEQVVELANLVRDDLTYAELQPALLAGLDFAEKLRREARGTRRDAALSLLLPALEAIVATARQIEETLDRQHALAPQRALRQLERREAQGESGEALAALHAQVAEGSALRAALDELSDRLRALCAHARTLPERFEQGAQRLEEESARLLDRAARPIPRRPPPKGGPKVAARIGAEELAATAPAAGAPRLRPGELEALATPVHAFARVNSIGAYRLTGLLGVGGMGVVYEALAPSGRRVALKTLRGGDEGRSQELSVRFERECRLLARVHHPGCVELLDSGQHGGELYCVLSFVDGVPLARVLARRQLTLLEVIGLGRELCEPLSYLHGQQIVHRDLKPANILLRRDGSAVISDFGLSARVTDTRITEEGRVVGTPGYVAPEILQGAPPTPASDQWSLGRVLFRAAVGRPARAGGSDFDQRLRVGAEIPWDLYPAPREWRPLRSVLERMLHADPAARFPDLAAVSRALVALGSAAELPALGEGG